MSLLKAINKTQDSVEAKRIQSPVAISNALYVHKYIRLPDTSGTSFTFLTV